MFEILMTVLFLRGKKYSVARTFIWDGEAEEDTENHSDGITDEGWAWWKPGPTPAWTLRT
jgi:hypothetical protein